MHVAIKYASALIILVLALVGISVSFKYVSPYIKKYFQGSEAKVAGISNSTNTPAVSFPRDHAAHNTFKKEWWYLNLSVKASNTSGNTRINKDFRYIVSFIRSLNSGSINQYGLLTSKYETVTRNFGERFGMYGTLEAYLKNDNTLFVKYKSNEEMLTLSELLPDSTGRVSYRLFGNSPIIGTFDLTLKEDKVARTGRNTPLLWGCTGLISVFQNSDTYYYSIPDLNITGTIRNNDGITYNVTSGKAWFDHQWFSSRPPETDPLWLGHYWTSMYIKDQITGNKEALGTLTQIYSNGPRYIYWVKRNSDGTNSCGTNLNYTISSYFQNRYPQTFQIRMGDSGINVINGTMLSDRQVHTSSGPEFFEASANITGSRSNGVYFDGEGVFETSLKLKQSTPSK